MPPDKDLDPSASVPEFHGAELRHKRKAAGLSLQELAGGRFYSVAFLSQIELGERRMPLDLARHADEQLKTDGFFERHCEDVRRARRGGHAEYFADFAELERRAQTIEEWSPALVPGLLQTEEYARAVIRAQRPMEQSADVERKVSARMGRAGLFEEPGVPELWVVLHELVLRQPIGQPAVMAEQFRRILEMSQRSLVLTQIFPLNAGAHPFMVGTFTSMTFPDAPSIVYTEGLHSGQLIDDPGLVREYRKSYDLVRAAALSPDASRAMIEAAAEDFRNDQQH